VYSIQNSSYVATVKYVPNYQSCYVSLDVPRPGAPPRSIKATFSGLGRSTLQPGVVVAVKRTDARDATKFAVTRVLSLDMDLLAGDVRAAVPLFNVRAARAEHEEALVKIGLWTDERVHAQQTEGDSDDMATRMSKDRVTFFLPPRYFQSGSPSRSSNGMCKTTCASVLARAFGAPGENLDDRTAAAAWLGVMAQYPAGFRVVCRPSQFARFIVYRADADECINGIKDLAPVLGKPRDTSKTYYDEVAAKTGVEHYKVCNVLNAAGVHNYVVKAEGEFDVSGNPHRECC
jgi:hypothetical protein